MITLTNLIAVFNSIATWLKTLGSFSEKQEARYKAALRALYLAANETKAYVATLKRRKNPDQDRELRLSKLWVDAAIELRKINKALAKKCILKAEYWADPTAWSDKQIDNTRDSLKEIYNECRKLLSK